MPAEHLVRAKSVNVKVLLARLCPALCDTTVCSSSRFLCAWDSPGKNTGRCCRDPTWVSHTAGQILYRLRHQGGQDN